MSRKCALAALLFVLAMARGALADEPTRPPADTNPATRPPSPAQPLLIIVGAAVTAGWYGAAVGVSYLWSENEWTPPLRIPVAGPYMAYGKLGCNGARGCDTFIVVGRAIFTTLTAVGQTGGVLAMLEGLFLPTGGPIGEAQRATVPQAASTFRVTPLVSGSNAAGLSIGGDF